MLTFSDCTMSFVEQGERVRCMCGIRLPSMDKVALLTQIKECVGAETQNNYCFSYLAVFSIRKPNFANVINRQLLEK